MNSIGLTLSDCEAGWKNEQNEHQYWEHDARRCHTSFTSRSKKTG